MASDQDKPPSSKIPGTYKAFVKKCPALGRAHEDIAKAAEEAGPLDARMLALIKIGVCVGAGLESALRSTSVAPCSTGRPPLRSNRPSCWA